MVYLCMVNDIVLSRGDETLASSESRLFAIEQSERAKDVLRAKTGRGFHPQRVDGGPEK